MSTVAVNPRVERVAVPSKASRKGSVSDAMWPVVPLGELAADERNAITDGPFGSKLKTDH